MDIVEVETVIQYFAVDRPKGLDNLMRFVQNFNFTQRVTVAITTACLFLGVVKIAHLLTENSSTKNQVEQNEELAKLLPTHTE